MTEGASKKMGIKEGGRAFLINVPPEAVQALALPDLEMASALTGEFDYLLLFTESQKDLNDQLPKLKAHLKPGGMLWVSWPKGGQLGTDLSLPKLIQLGYDHGLVESKTVSINATWSAIKYTHPKKGKVYKNRFGKLKPDQ